MPDYSLSTDSWDLHRRAERDRQRHNDKVKEVIKKNLGDIISQQDIITADNGKIVKIPIRGLELPRIRFDISTKIPKSFVPFSASVSLYY